MQASGQLHAPDALPRHPLDRRLGGPQKQSGRCGEEKNDAPASPSLYRLRYPDPTFRRNILPPTSGSMSKRSEQPALSKRRALFLLILSRLFRVLCFACFISVWSSSPTTLLGTWRTRPQISVSRNACLRGDLLLSLVVLYPGKVCAVGIAVATFIGWL
jgi:hypothetical protein